MPPILKTIPTALQCNEIPRQTNLASVKKWKMFEKYVFKHDGGWEIKPMTTYSYSQFESHAAEYNFNCVHLITFRLIYIVYMFE